MNSKYCTQSKSASHVQLALLLLIVTTLGLILIKGTVWGEIQPGNPCTGTPPDCRPEKDTILILTRTRSYRDGQLAGTYVINTNELIMAQVPQRFATTGGRWAMYGGDGKVCNLQKVTKGAYRVLFTCKEEGTYVAMFYPTSSLDPIFNNTDAFEAGPETDDFYIIEATAVSSGNPNMTYEQLILSGPDRFYYSDPFVIAHNSFCYRWGYRIDEINAVGVIHTQGNPHGSHGSFRTFEVKVWVLEPAAASINEVFWDKPQLSQTTYSKLLTKRFKELGTTPCVTQAHHSLEVTTEPVFTSGSAVDEDNAPIEAVFWKFEIKLYLDRMVSYVTDVSFTIKSRQLSGLYGCFIGDVRVFLRSKYLVFEQTSKFKKEKVNLAYSNFPEVMSYLITKYAKHFLGNKIRFAGYPWDRGDDIASVRKYPTIFPNNCLMQELLITSFDQAYVSEDGLYTQELNAIYIPGILEDEMLSDMYHDNVTQAKIQILNEEITRKSLMEPTSVTDFVFIPTHLVILRSDSILVLHPSDLDLKGLGVNYGTQKFRLGALVRKRWSEFTDTPKVDSQVVPAFSRFGNFIIIYVVPIEKQLTIANLPPQRECEEVIDSTKTGNRVAIKSALSEKEIHEDDPKTEIEAHLKHKSRAEEQEQARHAKRKKSTKGKARKDEEMAEFWYFGDYLIPKFDKHFAQGATDPANVFNNFTGKNFNRNVVFVVDKNFMQFRKSLQSLAGIQFRLPETLTTTTESTDRVRQPELHLLMAMHALEFSAVEKRYFAAVEFQSKEFRRADGRNPETPGYPSSIDQSTDNDLTMMIAQYDAFDLSLELPHADTELLEVELDNVKLLFSGCVLYRKDFKEPLSAYQMENIDFDVEGLINNGTPIEKRLLKEPIPLQKRTANLRTINTAFPFYVLTMGNVIIFGTTDCAFSRPLTFFEIANPTRERFNVVPNAVLKGSNYEAAVTEEGIISVMFHHLNNTDEQYLLVGSLLTNEPLRLLNIFLDDETYFQVSSPEGEILYGKTKVRNGVLADVPSTRFLEVPFWSLLRGTVLHSLGHNTFPLADVSDPNIEVSDKAAVARNDICSFSSFHVKLHKRSYIEAGYRIRLTAEVAFHGAFIPLDADLLVEFNEIQGVSILINAVLEVVNDLTLIRKTIDIESFLTEGTQKEIFEKHLERQDEESFTDYERVFTLTLRPSIVNVHCERGTYFKTIQFNIGCVYGGEFRLLAENLPLRKLELKDLASKTSEEELSTVWYWNKTGKYITAPRDRIHFKQRKQFQCENPETVYCKIPHADQINGDFYALSYRDSLVPQFEHFMTSHVRRVTGNVILYDILESWKDPHARLVVNTTQWNARCLADDEDWYDKLATKASEGEVHPHADIYQFYENCFTTQPSPRNRLSPDRRLMRAPDLNRKSFWIFNHTNYNAIGINRKGRAPRNYIYIIRAVVLNTEENSFTYCQVMDAYFAIMVDRVSPQREPLTWYIYLGIIFSVLLLVILSYIYFCRTYSWRTDLEKDKPRLIEEHKTRN